ncbi:MAG: hypothetical protein V4501_09970 [Pseudomonadota bacterium]
MSAARRNFNPKVVTSLVLWTGSIYSLSNLQKLVEQESDDYVKAYLNCLINFKNKANSNELLTQLVRLTEVVSANTDAPFLAAIYNLLGLTYRWLANYEKARESFASAIPYVKSNPISLAVLFSHLGYVLYEQQNISISTLLYPEEAVKLIKELPLPEDVEDRENIAAIYASLAFAYRKADLLNYAELAEQNYNNALKYWPENSRIANDRAILLSKINSEATLLRSEEHWAEVYDEAKRNRSFEESYYRADVAIKLAAINSGYALKAMVETYIKAAGEYLQSAEESLSVDSSNAPKASLYKLYARLAFVQGDLTLAEANNVIAKNLRSKVPEDADKKMKFSTGLVYTKQTGFNSVNLLFRYNPKSQNSSQPHTSSGIKYTKP